MDNELTRKQNLELRTQNLELRTLNGLILIGGRSTRMGSDKSLLNYHGLPQRDYLFNLLSKYCQNVFFSCRIDQQEDIQQNKIIDNFEIGPIGGILSAFGYDSDVAWLVVACDMPLIDEVVIEKLFQNRNPSKSATAFYNTTNNAPEPLITIYESSIFESLKEYIKTQNKSPLKLLQRADIQLIMLENEVFLRNVNTDKEYHQHLEKG